MIVKICAVLAFVRIFLIRTTGRDQQSTTYGNTSWKDSLSKAPRKRTGITRPKPKSFVFKSVGIWSGFPPSIGVSSSMLLNGLAMSTTPEIEHTTETVRHRVPQNNERRTYSMQQSEPC